MEDLVVLYLEDEPSFSPVTARARVDPCARESGTCARGESRRNSASDERIDVAGDAGWFTAR